MNAIAELEYEFAYYDSAVRRFNHYIMRTSSSTLLSDLNVVVWIVSICPLIYIPSRPLSKHLDYNYNYYCYYYYCCCYYYYCCCCCGGGDGSCCVVATDDAVVEIINFSQQIYFHHKQYDRPHFIDTSVNTKGGKSQNTVSQFGHWRHQADLKWTIIEGASNYPASCNLLKCFHYLRVSRLFLSYSIWIWEKIITAWKVKK